MTERKALKKSISFSNYVSIALGAIVGIGWVMYSGQWMQDGGPLGAMLAFLLVGIFLLPIGACYAELTSAIPVAGGEVAFTYKAFGPVTSFLTAWALALSYIFVLPFETIAMGALFESLIPLLSSESLYEVNGYKVSWSTMLPGMLIGIYLVCLNYRGAKSSSRFQMWVMCLLALCTFIFVFIAIAKGSVENLSPLFAKQGEFWVVAPASVISVMVVAHWFMGGFDVIPQAAEESGIKMKPNQLGIAILASIILGAFFYMLIILSVGMSVSSTQINELMQLKNVMFTAEVFRIAFGYEWLTKLVLFSALLGLITTFNSFFIASSRLLFSLGRGGMLPQWFARVHPVYGTPSNAIIFLGIVSLIGPLTSKAALSPIVNSSALAFTMAFVLTTCSAICLRRSAPALVRPYRAHIVTLYSGLAVSILLTLLMLVPGSPGFLSFLEFVIFGSWMFIGLAAYMLRRAKRDMSDDEQRYMILGEYR